MIRDVEAPVYDQEVAHQVEEVKKKKGFTSLRELILSGDVWEVK